MAKFVKNHWARLIILAAAAYQAAAAASCIFWPKIIFDTATAKLNFLVKPQPFLQIIVLVFAVLLLTWELPLNFISGTAVHRSIAARLVVLCLSASATGMLYQGTDACLYTCIGMVFYVWALAEGEVIYPEPWTFPDTVVKREAAYTGVVPPKSQRVSGSSLSDRIF